MMGMGQKRPLYQVPEQRKGVIVFNLLMVSGCFTSYDLVTCIIYVREYGGAMYYKLRVIKS